LTRRLKVETEKSSYPVLVGEEVLSRLGAYLKEVTEKKRLLLVSDKKVWQLFGEDCQEFLLEEGFQPYVKIIPPGEKSKSFQVAWEIYDAALEAEADRDTPVLALGGGVVGDLAGFVASTYLRGVPFIQVPTTLLSQVDSSVGGKVGINHPRGKNLIGSFYQPRLVAVELTTLFSLDQRQFRAGLAEVVKYGVMIDGDFFRWLENNLENLVEKKELSMLEHAITRSITIKAGIVKEDEREGGLRRILNLGHTFGHALEASTDYSHYLHGEAVLSGMDMAVSLARHLNLVSGEDKQRISDLLGRVGIIPAPQDITVEEICYRLGYDKKKKGECLVFVLPSGLGKVQIYADPPQDLLREVIEEHFKKFPQG